MSVGSRGASCSDVTSGSTGPAAGGKGDDSSVTQSQTTGSDATSGAAADCSMATDSSEAGDSPRDYNKMKYHSSKMDLNLMILRDQMTNLQSSGSSLSRQLASMYRTFQEIKDDDEGEDADSEYESEDEQIARDAVDTEDDVNKMSDLEKDYSEPKLRRSVSTGGRGKKPKNGARESNANEVTTSDGGHRRHSKSNSVDGSGESYQDSDSECSQCLCCNSIASYSSTPWRYVSRGEGSTMDEDSDSSEYFSDESEYSTTTCTSIPYDVNKRPFHSQSDGKAEDTDEGRFEDAEPVADLRMSPLGCESPRKCNSQPDLRSLLVRSESITKDTSKKPSESAKPGTEAQAPTTTEEEQAAAVKASSLIGIFKEQEAKAKQDQIAVIAKAKRVEELRRKNSEIRLLNEKKRKAEMESRMKEKTNQGLKPSPLAAENEETEKMNIRDRISNFEKQGKPQKESKESTTEVETEPKAETVKSKNVERGTNTEPDVGTVQQMPDVIPDVTEGKNDQADVDDHDKGHRSRRPKSKLAKTTIEIPVSCLPEQVVHPQSGTSPDQPTMMTFQVRPVDMEALGGPMLVARSPKPKRKTSKTIVRLSSTESPPSVSEATLVPDADTVKISGTTGKKPSGHSHSVCPHCQKKSKPGESKRVVKVLQLEPVPESPDMPPMSPVQQAEESAHIIQQQSGGGQIIKMVPSAKHGIMQRQESSKDGVVFRFNMGIPENAPLQVGDYIRIPIQPQQPKIRHQGGGVVIRTGGQSRRPKEILKFSQSAPPGVIVQPTQSPTSGGGVTVHMSQPGVRVMPSKGGGVKLVFGS